MKWTREHAVCFAAAGFLTMTAGAEAQADEPLFDYVNSTDLLPGGKLQIEQWLTAREGGGAGSRRPQARAGHNFPDAQGAGG